MATSLADRITARRQPLPLREFILNCAQSGAAPAAIVERSAMLTRSLGMSRPNGHYLDWQDFLPSCRALNITTAGEGGNFVATTIETPIVELLRNSACAVRLGARVLRLDGGNIAIPRQTSAATAYTLAETATATVTSQTVDQILLSPHRITASVEYSRQLLLQSSVDIEDFIRSDLMAIIGLKVDRLALAGTGADNEPVGILHTEGISSVEFDGPPTWAKVVSFETALAQSNVVGPHIAFLTTPSVRGVWKVTPKVSTTAFPIFIWENGATGDPANDGVVNGYKAASTNQLSDQGTVLYGRWSDLVIAFFGVPDVVVNPFSRDVDAITRITISVWMDLAVRHAQAFVVSADSGAQT